MTKRQLQFLENVGPALHRYLREHLVKSREIHKLCKLSGVPSYWMYRWLEEDYLYTLRGVQPLDIRRAVALLRALESMGHKINITKGVS